MVGFSFAINENTKPDLNTEKNIYIHNWGHWSDCILCHFTGKELVDYITKYLSSIRERRVIPDVKPGYMRELLPEAAPTEPEEWENIFNDIEKVIMPGVKFL